MNNNSLRPLVQDRTLDGRWIDHTPVARVLGNRFRNWFSGLFKHRRLIRRVTNVPLDHPEFKHLMLGSYTTKKGFWFMGREVDHPLIYRGDILSARARPDHPVLLRIDSGCFTGAVFQDRSCDCHQQLLTAMRMIDNEQDPQTLGLIIHHLHHEGKGHGFTNKLASYRLGMYPVPGDLREFRSAIAILKDLGIRRVILLTNNPDKIAVMENNGIEVVATHRIVISDPHLHDFYSFKRDHLGHRIP